MTLRPQDFTNEQIADAILVVLTAEVGRERNAGSTSSPMIVISDGWLAEWKVAAAVGVRFGSPNWPGDSFGNKVKRVVKQLVDDGKVVRIGRGRDGRTGVQYPTSNGQMVASFSSNPMVILAAAHVDVMRKFEAAREAQRRTHTAREEREAKLDGWLMDGGFTTEPVVRLDATHAAIPTDVLEALLIRVAQREIV